MGLSFSFFDALNEIIYIADTQTHELVYMNKAALRAFGLPSVAAVQHKPCYAVLRQRACPCADCVTPRMRQGEFCEWRSFDPALEGYFTFKDTLLMHQGRQLRFEMAINVSAEEQLQRVNQTYTQREAMLNQGISTALTKDDPETAICFMLGYLGEQFRSDRAYIFEPSGTLWNNTYEWCAPDIAAEKDHLQHIDAVGGLAGWLTRFAQGEHIIIDQLDAIKTSEPHVYAALAPQGIHSVVVAPVLDQGTLQAFFGLDNPSTGSLYNISDFLGITASFFDFLLKRRETMREFEKKVALRTRALEQSRQEAVTASQAKSVFLSTVSHEIRTPMNAIMGLIHLFKRDNLTAEQCDQLDKISASSSILLHLINDVLDISKIESGRLELEQRPFPLHQCVDVPSDIITPLTQNKGIDFRVTTAPNVPQGIEGDSQRISQVLINILNNAVKFTSQGYVALTVTGRQPQAPDNVVPDDTPLPTDAEGRVVLGFRVADTGIGIAPAQLKKIFEPFAQADNSITRRFGGSGLGLCISKKLVRNMGGDIQVTSTVGHGSVFDVTIRVRPVALADLPADPPVHNLHADAHHALAGKRLLLVEDNLINQEIAQAMLQQYGIQVTTANNGQMALDLLHTDATFDGILMDMQMPVMGGVEATQHIRSLGQRGRDANRPELARLATIPIIAMTANAMQEDKKACSNAGMDDYISKPIAPELLEQCLLRWFAAPPDTAQT